MECLFGVVWLILVCNEVYIYAFINKTLSHERIKIDLIAALIRFITYKILIPLSFSPKEMLRQWHIP
jgi:hypothetical protein